MMKNKIKKAVGFLISTLMLFLFCLGTPQGVRAEEIPDPSEFTGATEIGNAKWTDPDNHREYNVYLNDTGYFLKANTKVPARGPAHIGLNQAYKTRMDNILGYMGSVYDPGTLVYYYFTLEKPAKVTVYGQCSTASNSMLSIEKIDNIETFGPSTVPFGAVSGSDAVKSISTCLSAGNYLVSLFWGQGRPETAGNCYSYVKVNTDSFINQETDDEWHETFPNECIMEGEGSGTTYKYVCTPYQIGKIMNGVTGVGNLDRTTKYTNGYYSFTISETTQFNFAGLTNVKSAYVFPQEGGSPLTDNMITDTKTLEPGDYVLKVIANSKNPYSFKVSTPVVAGVDTKAESGWSVSKETVTINNLNVNAGEYAAFCIWSGDKDNAGYGKGNAKLVIKGNCFIKTLVIDCPVEVTCESGAKLVVGELVVNTAEGAGGKLTYASGTTYNAASKTFEAACTHTYGNVWKTDGANHWKECSVCGNKKDIAEHKGGTSNCKDKAICAVCGVEYGEKDAENHTGNTEVRDAVEAKCNAEGYTGDIYCKDCGVKLESGQIIEKISHNITNWTVTKEATISECGEKTGKCASCGEEFIIETAKLSSNPIDEENTEYEGMNTAPKLEPVGDTVLPENVVFVAEKTEAGNLTTEQKAEVDKAVKTVEKNLSAYIGEGKQVEKVDVLCVYDFDLILRNIDAQSGDSLGDEKYHFDGSVTVTTEIPEAMKTAKNPCLIHLKDDGTCEVVAFKNNGDGTISFTVNGFSSFALLSIDASNVIENNASDSKSAKTGDNSMLLLWIILLAVSTAVFVISLSVKRKTSR